jgi:hypothetical protein
VELETDDNSTDESRSETVLEFHAEKALPPMPTTLPSKFEKVQNRLLQADELIASSSAVHSRNSALSVGATSPSLRTRALRAANSGDEPSHLRMYRRDRRSLGQGLVLGEEHTYLPPHLTPVGDVEISLSQSRRRPHAMSPEHDLGASPANVSRSLMHVERSSPVLKPMVPSMMSVTKTVRTLHPNASEDHGLHFGTDRMRLPNTVGTPLSTPAGFNRTLTKHALPSTVSTPLFQPYSMSSPVMIPARMLNERTRNARRSQEITFKVDRPATAQQLQQPRTSISKQSTTIKDSAKKSTGAPASLAGEKLGESKPSPSFLPATMRLVFRVVDHGCGIPAESVPALFEPYTQAKRSITREHGGTGSALRRSSEKNEVRWCRCSLFASCCSLVPVWASPS